MYSRNWGFVLLRVVLSILLATLGANQAYAWYGPLCYSSKARQVSLTIPAMTGEAPGDIKVSFDDNDGKARLVAVRSSTKVKNAHEIILARDEDSRSGVFGIIVTSGRSSFGYKYEFEFRDKPEDCNGAIIKVSDKFAGDIGGSEASAPVKSVKTVAASAPKRRVKQVKAAVATEPESPVDTASEGASVAPVANGELVGPTMPSSANAPEPNSKEDAREGTSPAKDDGSVGDEASPKSADKVEPSDAKEAAEVKDSIVVKESAPVNGESAAAQSESESAGSSANEADSPGSKR